MVFSKDGIEPDPKKVDSLIMMTPPTSIGDVQSILGMTHFLARCIPHYSTIRLSGFLNNSLHLTG